MSPESFVTLTYCPGLAASAPYYHDGSAATLEEEFAQTFVRIHRNALVNTRFLERIARDASGQYFVHLRGLPDALEVSRRMAGDLKDRFRI